MSSAAFTATPPTPPAATRCLRCGAEFTCGSGPECWCMDLPHQPMPQAAASCLCPACLRREIEAAAAS